MKLTHTPIFQVWTLLLLTTVLSAPVSETGHGLDLESGFARCYDTLEASTRAAIKAPNCQRIANHLISGPAFQYSREYTTDNPPQPITADGCTVVVQGIREGVSDTFSLGLVGSVVSLVNIRCSTGEESIDRGGFGLVGPKNLFRVEMYNPPTDQTVDGATGVPLNKENDPVAVE